MRYEIVGSLLIFTSAFLYVARYITAALFFSFHSGNYSPLSVLSAYNCVGVGLTNWSILALIAGLGIIITGFVATLRKQKIKK